MRADFEPRVTTINYELPVDVSRNAQFGGMAISQELYHYLCAVLPEGSTILELGSGYGTSQLAKRFVMYSVEHNADWVNRYNSTYIHAPIENSWYSVDAIKRGLPKHYDLILIDGPPRRIGRRGFFKNLEIFNVNVPLVFDDIHDPNEFQDMIDVAKKLERDCYQYVCKNKKWGVILPN